MDLPWPISKAKVPDGILSFSILFLFARPGCPESDRDSSVNIPLPKKSASTENELDLAEPNLIAKSASIAAFDGLLCRKNQRNPYSVYSK